MKPRSTPLKADPAKTAAFVQRGRGKLKRSATAPSDFRDDEGQLIANRLLACGRCGARFRHLVAHPARPSLVACCPICLSPWHESAALSAAPFVQPDRRGKPRKVVVPTGARRAAVARSHGGCVVCLHREGVGPADVTATVVAPLLSAGRVRSATTVHHVFPRQKWPHLIKVAENLVGACFDCHMAHEYPGVKRTRIPLAALPVCAVALATDDGSMQNYLARTYAA